MTYFHSIWICCWRIQYEFAFDVLSMNSLLTYSVWIFSMTQYEFAFDVFSFILSMSTGTGSDWKAQILKPQHGICEKAAWQCISYILNHSGALVLFKFENVFLPATATFAREVSGLTNRIANPLDRIIPSGSAFKCKPTETRSVWFQSEFVYFSIHIFIVLRTEYCHSDTTQYSDTIVMFSAIRGPPQRLAI